MVSRREMLTGGTLAGLVGAVAPADARDMSQQEIDLKPVTSALGEIRDELREQTSALAVSREFTHQLRGMQKTHFRTHGRFPVWIDIGIDVFESVYDWHIRNEQALTVGREANGRYTITFFFSTLVLRSDVEPNYISAPYDER